VNLYFDSFIDAGGLKSACSTSNFILSKFSDTLRIFFNNGIPAGSGAFFNSAGFWDKTGFFCQQY
jgi:hypothetical protein